MSRSVGWQPGWITCSALIDVNRRCQSRDGDLCTVPDQLLRRQDSNLDYRNQNPRCCLYTTADRRVLAPQVHRDMVTIRTSAQPSLTERSQASDTRERYPQDGVS
jgi:hypothetical protein